MNKWFQKNIDNPHGCSETYKDLASLCKISEKQVRRYLIRKRKFFKKNKNQNLKRMTCEQLNILTKYYQLNKNPDCGQILKLEEKTGLSKKKIKAWFANKRFQNKFKKEDN